MADFRSRFFVTLSSNELAILFRTSSIMGAFSLINGLEGLSVLVIGCKTPCTGLDRNTLGCPTVDIRDTVA